MLKTRISQWVMTVQLLMVISMIKITEKNYQNSNLTQGDNSPIIVNSSITISMQRINWDILETDALRISNVLNEKEASSCDFKSFMRCIYSKDIQGLKTYLKKYSKMLLTKTVVSVLSNYTICFLNRLI